MAIEKYLVAIRDYLHEKEGWDSTTCRVGMNGQPYPDAGNFSTMLHIVDWMPRDLGLELAIDQQYALQITFTERSTVTPYDRWGEDFVLNTYGNGLFKTARRIIARLSKDAYPIMNIANSQIPDAYDKFIEPFFWVGSDGVPTIRDGTWFHTQAANPILNAGQSLGIRFRGARIKEAHARINMVT